MGDEISRLELLYDHFNKRDIDGVIAELTEDVVWANGMDGGYVHGPESLRDYWTRQWATVSPHVQPVAFRRIKECVVVAEVEQNVRDLQGRSLADQAHGLRDKKVRHVFHFRGSKICRFEIE